MCFMSYPLKKSKASKPTPKVSPEAARINLTSQGASFSFSPSNDLPSNFFIRQDFYSADNIKTHPSPPETTAASAYIYGPYPPAPPLPHTPTQVWPHLALAPPSYATTDLSAAVSEAQRLACNLKHAYASHSSCSSGQDTDRDRDRDRDRERDRETLLLSLERKNADAIAALRLERDIESTIRGVVRERDVQALMGAAAAATGGVGGFGGGGGGGGYGGVDGGYGYGNRCARAAMESENQLLWERIKEHEQERERIREKERDREIERDRRLARAAAAGVEGGGGGGGGWWTDAQMQVNLFQDLSRGGCESRRGAGGGGGGEFVDGVRDGWERRRRSSVVSTLDMGARRLAEAMARVEAEVEFIRRRDRGGERRRGYL